MKLLDRIFPKRQKNKVFKTKTAAIAKERLQIIVSHERRNDNPSDFFPDFFPKLQKELTRVIAKYIDIDQKQVKVELGKTGNLSILELNITLPNKDVETIKTAKITETIEAPDKALEDHTTKSTEVI